MYNSNNSTIICIISLILGCFATLEWCPGTTRVKTYYLLLFFVLYSLFEIISAVRGGAHYNILFFAQNL